MANYNTIPRAIAVVGGYQVPFESWNVETNAFTSADTFQLTLPFVFGGRSTKDFILRNADDLASALVTEADVQVQIYAGQPSNPRNYGIADLTQIMDGFVDSFDFYGDDQGERVMLTGRNQAGALIDTVITDKFPNQTSSQIAYQGAALFGLTPIITDTYTLVGAYYNQDATIMTNQTNWLDLLTFLGKQEGFVVRVVGISLYFGPLSGLAAYAQPPIPLTWRDNLKSFQLTREPHAARDIEVQVISYDANHKNRIVEKATSTTQYSQRLKNQIGRQRYVETYAIPGLTRQQAADRAQQILEQLSSQQIVGQLNATMEYGYDVYRPIQLGGVGAVLSTSYYPNRITRTFDKNSGLLINIAATSELLTSSGAA